MNAVEIHDLVKRFGSFVAVDHVSLEVAKGEILGCLGPNGAGKTTTIKMLTTLLKPTSGRIEIEIPFNAPPDQPCKAFLDDGSKLGGASAELTSFPVVDQYSLQAEAFSRAVRTGGSVENSIELAVGNMRAIDALFRSAETGGWVNV